ncbi:trypsin-like serine protease [Gymnodinialimonas sp. 2305UL16-5]|uniref:trypsin-like serine peptidase n=1 Tax=Gymnodinialimonas mytili TaxID=3126503 RepID=UPI0030AFEF2A
MATQMSLFAIWDFSMLPNFRQWLPMLAAASVLCALPFATAAQIMPQPGDLRPIQTADDARGWEAVGRLDTGVSFCSATLIAPDLVLTAAHCLFDDSHARIPNENLRFSASLRNGRADAVGRIARSFIPDAYVSDDDGPTVDTVSDDVALLELTQPVINARVSPLQVGRRGRTRDLVTVVSYGRDRADYASIEEDCAILASQLPIQILSCNAVPGTSGAPILRETGAGVEVIGVVSAIGEWNDDDATFAVAIDDILPALMAEYESTRRGFFGGTSAGVRSLSVGNGGRDTIGARFIRP